MVYCVMTSCIFFPPWEWSTRLCRNMYVCVRTYVLVLCTTIPGHFSFFFFCFLRLERTCNTCRNTVPRTYELLYVVRIYDIRFQKVTFSFFVSCSVERGNCLATNKNKTTQCCCCLHIKPFFLPKDISSTPSVLPVIHPREIKTLWSQWDREKPNGKEPRQAKIRC